MKNIGLIIGCVLFISCNSSKTTTPLPTQTKKVAPTTLAALNQGKEHYQQHCAHCHSLQNPTSKTEEQWRQIVPKMVGYINEPAKIVVDEKAEASILNYLITMSNKD